MQNLSRHTPFTSVNLAPISVRLGVFAFVSALTSIFAAVFAAARAARA